MNAIALAMKNAGVKTPTQMQLIWNFLKDSPRANVGLSADDVFKGVKLPSTSVSSILHQMELRGMVSSSKHVSKLQRGRQIKLYMAVGHTYELKPQLVKKPKQSKLHERLTGKTLEPIQHVEAAPKQVVHLHKRVSIEHLTIREAREMYEQLKEMFA